MLSKHLRRKAWAKFARAHIHTRQFIYFYLFILLDFIYRGSLFSIFTTLIYHRVLINNKTEQDTEQDKQTKILLEQFTYILTQYI